MVNLTPRQTAVLNGALRYQGKPCAHGHSGERYTSSGTCCECVAASNDARRVRSRPKRVRHEDPLLAAAFLVRLHPDDHAAMYALADHLNAARGRPPVLRPDLEMTVFERYLERESRRLRGLGYGPIAQAAAVLGIPITFGQARDEMHWRREINGTPDGSDPVQANTPNPSVEILKKLGL